jgi:hypothetical protein
MSLIKLTEKSNFDNLYSKPVCHVIWKAFSILKNTAAVDMLLKLRVTWSGSLVHCKVLLWLAWNPDWFAFSSPLLPMCLWTIFRITFSNSLPVVGKGLISLKFLENVEPLPCFSKVIIFSSFQGFGKWEIRRQLLIEVKVTLRLTVSQSVSMSRYWAHSGTCDQILLSVRRLFSESCCLVSMGLPFVLLSL